MNSKIFLSFLMTLIVFSVSAHNRKKPQELTVKMIDNCLDQAIVKAKNMSKTIEFQEDALPRSIDKNGKLVTSNSSWWTSGFYPGELWYLYEYSRDTELLRLANKYSMRIENQQYTKDTHDLGFMLFCSFGNGFRLTGNKKYEEVLKNGAKSLMTRYNPNIGLIRSWDFGEDLWQYPVIIDNMMNLELLYWVTQETKGSTMYAAATSHAIKTMKNHFRPDYSCFHVVSYDTITGLPHIKQTNQGLNDSSAWARGQAWALYGFTLVYRFTKDKQFLDHAVKVANFIMNHPSTPEDKIQVWDFNAPKGTYRDASAAAIIASALIELSDYAPEQRTQYLDFTKQQLISLSSAKYFAKKGTNGNFILMHSVGSLPHNSEVDVPLSYADYYYVEALCKYKKYLMKSIVASSQDIKKEISLDESGTDAWVEANPKKRIE
jgi:unsaturated chondroitin disaccharide hydrolase